jgi:hypothetical protein
MPSLWPVRRLCLQPSARSLRDDRRKRSDARKHLIQSGVIEILDVADYRPFLVEK